jgi:hypothetical protein
MQWRATKDYEFSEFLHRWVLEMLDFVCLFAVGDRLI